MSNFGISKTFKYRKIFFTLIIYIHLTLILILMSKGLVMPHILQSKKGIFLEKFLFNCVEANQYILKNLLHPSLYFSAVEVMTSEMFFETQVKIQVGQKASVMLCYGSCDPTRYTSHLSHYLLLQCVVLKFSSIYCKWMSKSA